MDNLKEDLEFMELAINEAKKALLINEVPVGAVLVSKGKIIASAHNTVERDRSSLMHAEIKVIYEAQKKMENWRLTNSTLYVTLEPCIMCCGAIMLARIKRLVFGAGDIKFGGAGSLYDLPSDKRLNHNVEVCRDIMKEESIALLKSFFKDRRSG